MNTTANKGHTHSKQKASVCFSLSTLIVCLSRACLGQLPSCFILHLRRLFHIVQFVSYSANEKHAPKNSFSFFFFDICCLLFSVCFLSPVRRTVAPPGRHAASEKALCLLVLATASRAAHRPPAPPNHPIDSPHHSTSQHITFNNSTRAQQHIGPTALVQQPHSKPDQIQRTKTQNRTEQNETD